LTRIFDTTRERRTAAETNVRRSRRAKIDRVRVRLDDIKGDSVERDAQLRNVMKAIVDIMADDGDYE
jgi:hypothetical protein